MLLSEKWIHAGTSDEFAELRELPHLSVDSRFTSFFQLPYGSISADESAIVGRAGCLFIKGGSNHWLDQLNGVALIDELLLQSSVADLHFAKDKCNSLGIQFALCIFPEKDIIYPDLSPNITPKFCDHRSVHKLIERADLILSYPYMELIANSSRVRTYHARNSHTNFFGGMIVTSALLHSLGRPGLYEAPLQTGHVYWPDDLSIKWVDGLHTRRRVLKQTFLVEELGEPKRNTGKYLRYENASSRTKETVLIFGDSFSWNPDSGLAPLLSFEFRNVHFKWQKFIDWQLVEQLRPSILILESAERFLIKGLPTN